MDLQQLPKRYFNHRTWMEIDLDAFHRNYQRIHNRIPKTTKIMLIVKADGYGLGDADIAAAVNDYSDDWYGVCSLNEALNVRSITKKPILILTYTAPEFTNILIEQRITQTVVSPMHTKALAAEAEQIGIPLQVHIKLDTGINRIGLISYGEHWKTALKETIEILENPWLHVTGVFTHVATMLESDEKSKAFREEQVAAYLRVTEELLRQGYNLGLRHVSNSGGVFNMPELADLDMVRVGNVLYNVCPKRFFEQPVDVESVVAFIVGALENR